MVNNEHDGKKVWNKLIKMLVDKDIQFDLVNNVLTFKGLPKGVKGLWFWFGEVKVAGFDDKKSGDMLNLSDFKFDENNEIILYFR